MISAFPVRPAASGRGLCDIDRVTLNFILSKSNSPRPLTASLYEMLKT